MKRQPAWKAQRTCATDFLIREPASTYHARRGELLTSHQLAEFRRCPQLFRQRQLGLARDADRPAYLVGRAAHTLILEGRERFDQDYVVGGPINPSTGKPFGEETKAWAKWAATEPRTPLTDEQYELVSRLHDSVHAHPIAASLLRQGVPEGVVRTKYRNVSCQVRIDWFDTVSGITDLKTADNLEFFETDARRFGYLHQVAFYQAIVALVAGERFPVHFIAVEKKPPFRTGVWQVTADVLAVAQQDNEAALDRLRGCQHQDLWPTGYEALRVYDYV
jgi:hypothetical protein